ncbi:unnamed protein product [Closterium sp. Naga37s-1]|nr:unnamed protein product [Closterium sp. Naga37s-1]
MLSVLRVHLPSDIPIAGCELCPYVLLRKPDGTITTEDIPDTNPIDGYYIRCRWYRVQSDKRVAVCSVHGNEPATLQCLGCVKAKLPIARSYHCSPLCFQAAWPRHRALHSRGLGGSTHGSSDGTLPGEMTSGGAAGGPAGGVGGAQRRENGATAEEEELFGKFNSGNGTTGLAGAGAQGGMGNGAPGGGYGQGEQQQGAQQGMQGMQRPMGGGFAHRPPGGLAYQSDTTGGGSNASGGGSGEVWFEVGRGKPYTPTTDDVGHVLKLECVPIEAATGLPVAPPSTLLTSRVIPAPSPTPRRMVSVGAGEGEMGGARGGGGGGGGGGFTVLSYNVLADLYATSEMYSYCPPWALSWAYRKQNLLRELMGYRADIMCLQEVQSDHFEEFFGPELEKQGYASVFKKKTAEVYTGTAYAIDGCATFFRRDRFSLVKKYEVEFNKAALSLSEALAPPTKKAALNRLLKDNVALIVVLEARDAGGADGKDGANAPPAKRQLLCVANTHIHANPELKDVKLWQVHTLLKGLEKIAASADIPMLVAGDFNSVPGSAPHSLLATGRVDANHPELATDPLGILRPASKLCHQLPLVSAYASLSRGGSVAERQRRRMDASSSEPLFTNVTRDFMGTLDYTFYTAYRSAATPCPYPSSREPLFPNLTHYFMGTLDHSFYTTDSLSVESVLELLDEDSVRKDTALASQSFICVPPLPFPSFPFLLPSLQPTPSDSLSVESVLELLDEDSVRKDTALPSQPLIFFSAPRISFSHCSRLPVGRIRSRAPGRGQWRASGRRHGREESAAGVVRAADSGGPSQAKQDYSFTDEGPSVEVRVPIPAALRPIQARHVAVSVQEDALSVAVTPPAGFGSKEGAVKGKEGRERSLLAASPLYGRVKASESAWYIDDTEIAWPTLIKGWEALAGAVANQLKSCSVLLVGGSSRLNAAVAAEMATGLGYAPIMTQQLVEQLASATIDEVHRMEVHRMEVHRMEVHRMEVHRMEVHRMEVHRMEVHRMEVHRMEVHRMEVHRMEVHRMEVPTVASGKARGAGLMAKEEGADSVAQAETALLDHLSSYPASPCPPLFRPFEKTLANLRVVVATMGQPYGASLRPDSWRFIHGGIALWLDVKGIALWLDVKGGQGEGKVGRGRGRWAGGGEGGQGEGKVGRGRGRWAGGGEGGQGEGKVGRGRGRWAGGGEGGQGEGKVGRGRGRWAGGGEGGQGEGKVGRGRGRWAGGGEGGQGEGKVGRGRGRWAGGGEGGQGEGKVGRGRGRWAGGGEALWLDVKGDSESPPDPHFADRADVAIRLHLPAGWSMDDVVSADVARAAAEGALTAAKAALDADPQLPGKKSLYVRMGCRGDWPDLMPPSWDPNAQPGEAEAAAAAEGSA